MFSMPVIYHSSMKADDGNMGALHLNALNGSSGVLDLSSSGNASSLHRNGSFGNLFPPSENFSTYRQNDNNKILRETIKYSHSSSSLSSLSKPSSIAVSSKPDQRETESHSASETRDLGGSRRNSLGLDATYNTHRRYDDRSFSLMEATAVSAPSVSRHGKDPAVTRRRAAGLNLTALRINQGIVRSADNRDQDIKLPVLDSTCKSCEVNSKKGHGHSSETSMPRKTRKFLEKIRSNTSDHNIRVKHRRGRSESRPEERSLQLLTSKSGSTQPSKPRHEVEPIIQYTGSRHREGENAL